MKICVYCSSSNQIDKIYLDDAYLTGETLAKNNITLVYGGGSKGSMGKCAEGALDNNGKVIGIIPKFMIDLEWAHNGLTELNIVEDMRERKEKLIEGTDAVIALPGGCGTWEELFEAVTLKRLGLYCKPIILVNTNNFYDPLIELLKRSTEENFMDKRHNDLWQVIDDSSQLMKAINNPIAWSEDARKFASI